MPIKELESVTLEQKETFMDFMQTNPELREGNAVYSLFTHKNPQNPYCHVFPYY